MNKNNISIQERSEKFSIRIVKAYSSINKIFHFNSAIVVMSKQLLRSGTSIGANIAEAKYAQSNKDFISKYSIALKEANETKYWINLMIKSEEITENKMSFLIEEVNNIINILISIIKKLKLKND